MNIEFRTSFEQDLLEINDKVLLTKIQTTIEIIETVSTPNEIPNLKKLKIKGNYYRIRVGNHRIGLTLKGDTFTFVRVLPRKDIYRDFP